MTFDSLLDAYGYRAVLVGTFLEGETILVLGGVLARIGYLHLHEVILRAFIGSLCGDQLFFYLGRSRSRKILSKRPSWKLRVDKDRRYPDPRNFCLDGCPGGRSVF
jgi:membrane protein DedA with SNARE-associated domain